MIPAHVEPVAFTTTDAIAIACLLAAIALAVYLYRRN